MWFFMLLWQLQEVSCVFWQIGDCEHVDDSMFIHYAALEIIGSELCIHVGYCDHANDYMYVHSLHTIGGELYILIYYIAECNYVH